MVDSSTREASTYPLLSIYKGQQEISNGYFHLAVDFNMWKVFQIVTTGIRYFLAMILQSHPYNITLNLQGGAVLALLRGAFSKLADFPLEVNDLDYRFNCSSHEMETVLYATNLLRFSGNDITVPIDMGDSTMKFKIIRVIDLSDPSERYSDWGIAVKGLVTLETTVDGKTWKIDIANNFGNNQVDYHANTIPIVYNRNYPNGVLEINTHQLKSLVYLVQRKPQPCVIFENNKDFTRESDESEKSLDKLIMSFARIIKCEKKGFVTRNISKFKADEECPICQTSHKDSPARDSDDDTDCEGESDTDLRRIGMRLKCGHSICAMCFYIMRRKYHTVESYDIRCPMCRKDISFHLSNFGRIDLKPFKMSLRKCLPEWFGQSLHFREKMEKPWVFASDHAYTTGGDSDTVLHKIQKSIEDEYPSSEGREGRGGRGGRGGRRGREGREGGRGEGRTERQLFGYGIGFRVPQYTPTEHVRERERQRMRERERVELARERAEQSERSAQDPSGTHAIDVHLRVSED